MSFEVEEFLLTVLVASGILCLEAVSLRVDSLESTPLDTVSFLYSNFVGVRFTIS